MPPWGTTSCEACCRRSSWICCTVRSIATAAAAEIPRQPVRASCLRSRRTAAPAPLMRGTASGQPELLLGRHPPGTERAPPALERQQLRRALGAPEGGRQVGEVVEQLAVVVERQRRRRPRARGARSRRAAAARRPSRCGRGPAAAPTTAWSMVGGTASSRPDVHTSTGRHPRSPKPRIVQSPSGWRCLSTNALAVDHDPLERRAGLAVGAAERRAARCAPAISSSIDAAGLAGHEPGRHVSQHGPPVPSGRGPPVPSGRRRTPCRPRSGRRAPGGGARGGRRGSCPPTLEGVEVAHHLAALDREPLDGLRARSGTENQLLVLGGDRHRAVGLEAPAGDGGVEHGRRRRTGRGLTWPVRTPRGTGR